MFLEKQTSVINKIPTITMISSNKNELLMMTTMIEGQVDVNAGVDVDCVCLIVDILIHMPSEEAIHDNKTMTMTMTNNSDQYVY